MPTHQWCETLHRNARFTIDGIWQVSLLRSSFHIYGLDFRGHGRSPSSSDITLSLKLFADDVADALRTLRLDACYVFGHSLGGAVALACAANNPALFIGLFLFEPVVCAPSYSPTCAPKHLDSCILLTTNTTPSIELEAGTELLASIAQRRKGTFVSRAAAAANLRAKHPYAAFDPLSFDAFLIDGLRPAAGQTVQLACAPATEAAVFRFAAREAIENVFHRLGTVRAPAMVACGADTGAQFMWLPEGSKQVADALGNGKHTQYGFCISSLCFCLFIYFHVAAFARVLLHQQTAKS